MNALGKWVAVVVIGLWATPLCLQITGTGAQQKPAESNGATPARDYPVKPVPFTAVHFHDGFWAPRIEINRTVTIPFAFEKDEETGRLDNFVRAAAALKDQPHDTKPPGYPFDDTDVYKVIEGAAYTLSVTPDPKLEAYVDGLIEKIGAAQEKDGYLYTTRTISPTSPHPWAGMPRKPSCFISSSAIWVMPSPESRAVPKSAEASPALFAPAFPFGC